MQWVDIIQFEPASLSPRTVVRFTCDDGTVRWEGDAALGARIAEDGVYSRSLDRRVAAGDGEDFLRGLGEEYRSPHFFATEMSDSPPPPLS